MKTKIPLFGRFPNEKYLTDMVDDISNWAATSRAKDTVKSEIYILLGCFEQTVINGYKDDDEGSTED